MRRWLPPVLAVFAAGLVIAIWLRARSGAEARPDTNRPGAQHAKVKRTAAGTDGEAPGTPAKTGAPAKRRPWAKRLLEAVTPKPEADSKAAPAPSRIKIEVVDARSGAPLTNIAVRHSRRGGSGLHPFGHVTGKGRRFDHSPIELASSHRSETYFVRAPGYAWQSVTIFPVGNHRTRLELQPAGTLVVLLENFTPAADTRLVLSRKIARGRFVPPDDGRLRFDDIRAGAYEIAVHAAPPLGPVLGTARAVVPPGGVARATIELEPRRPGLPFSGRFEVPAAWGAVQPNLWIRGEVGRKHVLVENGAWSAGSVAAGRYRLELRPFGLAFLVNVAAPGRENLVVRVPDPARAVVKVVDQNEAPVAAAFVTWRANERPGIVPGNRERARSRSRAGEYGFRAPIGPVEVRVSGDGVVLQRRRVVLKPGENRVDVAVKRLVQLRVVTRIDGMPRAAPDGFEFRATPLGHDGEEEFIVGLGSSADPSKPGLVSRPGKYSLTFEVPEDFLPIPPREVDLKYGTTDVVVDLKRR